MDLPQPDLAKPRDAGPPPDEASSPRADLHDALGWMVLGLAIVIASWKMSRLEDQHINPLTIPGLVPGLLGAGMIIIGAILGLRSWERHRRESAHTAPTTDDTARLRRKRVLLTIILCCGYSIVLIGHGLPFWLASSIYVTGSILALDRLHLAPDLHPFSLRSLSHALLVGVGSSIVVWLVFERLFLVRLP
ncbi:tripartite tricarboxylate transporter TctB family protein [uncultured Castellaniella sp.]|uniref:tripartite tricarboxylate transporter TctB family protein n=1 Tax=uncultured Castellaniella sp. TaxID=647907 RepID=UPI00261FD720|nr:tripartite tricarboxylate transporter TctB family protein [uncultured Castellaniella sp.]